METHGRTEALGFEESQGNKSILSGRPLIVFDDARATAVLATTAEADR